MASRRRVVYMKASVVTPKPLAPVASVEGGEDSLTKTGEREIVSRGSDGPEWGKAVPSNSSLRVINAINDLLIRVVRRDLAYALGKFFEGLLAKDGSSLNPEDEALVLEFLSSVSERVGVLVNELEEFRKAGFKKTGVEGSDRPSQIRLSELGNPAAVPAVDDDGEVPPKSA